MDVNAVNKKKFEVKEHLDKKTGRFRKDIFVDDELFEYEVDKNAMKKASELGPIHFKAISDELKKHFLSCLSEFVGREITNEDVECGIKTGWI